MTVEKQYMGIVMLGQFQLLRLVFAIKQCDRATERGSSGIELLNGKLPQLRMYLDCSERFDEVSCDEFRLSFISLSH